MALQFTGNRNAKMSSVVAIDWDFVVDKPDIVLYEPQSLTEAEQLQARTNIGAARNNFKSVLDFGAEGDGTTNDTAAFENAVTSADLLFVPDGTYLIDGVTLHKKIHIILAPGATLKLRSVSRANCFLIQFGSGSDGSIVEGGTYDGNRDAFKSQFLLWEADYPNGTLDWTAFRNDGATDVTIERVIVRNTSTFAGRFGNGDRLTLRDWTIIDCGKGMAYQYLDGGLIDNIKSYNSSNDGLAIYQHEYEFRQLHNCTIKNIFSEGFAPTKEGLEPYPIAVTVNRCYNSLFENIRTIDFAGESRAETIKSQGFIVSYAKECSFRDIHSDNYITGLEFATLDGCVVDGVTVDGNFLSSGDVVNVGVHIWHAGQVQSNPADSTQDTLLPTLSRRSVFSNMIIRRTEIGLRVAAENVDFNNINSSGNDQYGIVVRADGPTISFPKANTQISRSLTFGNCKAQRNGYAGLFMSGCDEILVGPGGDYSDNGQRTDLGAGFRAGIRLFGSLLGGVGKVYIADDVRCGDDQTFTKASGLSFNPGASTDGQKDVYFLDTDNLDLGQVVTLKNAIGSDINAKIIDYNVGTWTVKTTTDVTYVETGNLTALSGTISSTANAITGVGTDLDDELKGICYIKAAGSYYRVEKADTNTTGVVSPSPSPALSGATAQVLLCDVVGIPSQQYGVYIDGDVTGPVTVGNIVTDGVVTGAVFGVAASTILPAINNTSALGSTTRSWSDLFLGDGAVINFNSGDVLITHSLNTLTIAGGNVLYGGNIAPLANDGSSLGVSGTAWSDLFLASGSVINFAAGDVTITHSANALAFAGASTGYTFDAPLTATQITRTGSNTNAIIGPWGGNSSYNAITLNGSLVSGSMSGFFSGGTGPDNALYLASPTDIALRPGGATSNTAVFASGGIPTFLSATAVPAGGTTGSGIKMSSTANLGIFFGSGAPTLSAAQGSLYLRTDGSSTSTRMYINTNGTTGWTNVVTAA